RNDGMSKKEKSSIEFNDQKKSHDPKIATILSIIFAGLGQIYNKRYLKGSILIVLEIAFLITCTNFINLGLWGLRTLGTIPGEDLSIFLLVYVLISLLLITFAVAFYVLNVKDARKQAILISQGWRPPSIRESIKNAYDKSFVYLLTVPGFVLLIFSVLLPLLFAVSLAFTNYDLYNSPPKNLLDWVGFENFSKLLSVPLWKDTFVSVFSWTIIWTVVATSFQIALGLFLALLANDERVKFKKLIRTIL